MPVRKGVKYLKIAKTDASGVDRTDTLRQLRSINIKYRDVGVVQYDIKSRSEYSTYLLYRVDYINPTSSIDRGVLDYITNTTATTGPVAINVNQSSSVAGYGTSNTYFNSTTGLYTFSQRLPNTSIIFTASAQASPSSPGNSFQPFIRLVLTGSSFTRTVISQSQAISPVISDTTITVSGSFVVPAENAQYYLEVANGSAGSAPCDFTVINLKVSQSIASTGNTAVITSPAPDTNEIFTGTDCDVTYGIAEEYPSSQYYMETDYSTGILVPTNFDKIISQSATLAAVKDYYYALQRHTKPRYQGSRTNTYKVNEYTPANDSIIIDGDPYEGDEGYIKDPGIENKKVYFGWFQEAYGATPEVNNAVNVNIKYLINEASGTLSPNLDSFFLGELRDTFQQGENLELSFVDAKDGTNSTPTAIKRAMSGLLPIYRSGVKAVPIMYSQTGSGAGAYASSIVFNLAPGVQAQTVPVDFRFGAQLRIPQGQTYDQNTETVLIFNEENWDFSGNYNTSTGEYTFNQTPTSLVSFKVLIPSIELVAPDSDIQIKILKNGSVIGGQRYTLNSRTPLLKNQVISTPFLQFVNGDTVKVSIYVEPNVFYFPVRLRGQLEFQMDQQSISQQALANSIPVAAPYFFTNSADYTILTASSQFSSYLNQTSQIDISGSGFDSVFDLASFKVGDQLRFENDEAKVYTINRILTQSAQGENYFLLDKPVVFGTNVNYFLLRRFIDDPTNIIVQAVKPPGGTGAGTIKPQYITGTLDKNLGRVVQKLQQQNTI